MNTERNLFPQAQMPPPIWQFGPQPTAIPLDNKRQWEEIWRSVRKRQWAIIGISAVAALVAALVAYSMQPVYRSTATVLIESGKAKILSIEEVYSGVSQDREYYQTQVEIMRSRDVALKTVLDAKLWNEPEFNPRAPRTGLFEVIKDTLNKPPPLPTLTPQQLADATVNKFQGAVSVEPVRLSQLVKVSFEAHDPQLAANMANAVAHSYIEADRDGRLRLTQDVNVLLQDRMSALREKLSVSEQALQSFREKEGLVNISGSAQGVAGQQMSELTQRLLTARVKRTELESAYQEAQRLNSGDYSTIPLVLGNPAISEARARVNSAALKLEEVSRVYGPSHSFYVQAQSELQSAQQYLKSQTQAVLTAMRRDYLAAKETERSLDLALTSAKGDVQGVNRQEFQLGVLEREVQANKQLYELFLSRVKETSISSNLQAAVARVVDSASAASAPVRPNKAQIIGLAFILALVATSVGSVLIDTMDNTVRNSEDAEHKLRHHVLTTLPTIVTSDQRALPRFYLDKPMSNHAEGIRTARSGVLLSSAEVKHRTLLITSTFEAEGKSTIATNLAFAHAQTKRTVLIDANMRDPQIGRRLGLPPDAKGLSDLIAGTSDIRDCVHEISGSPLSVIPAGITSLNPQDLLLSRRFKDLLESLATRVEIIIIDSPPVTSVSDSLIISAVVSDTIYVIKALETTYPAARKGIERLERAGANVLGIVINQAHVGQDKSNAFDDTAESRFADRRRAPRGGSKGGGFWRNNRRRADTRAEKARADRKGPKAASGREQRGNGVTDGPTESMFAAVSEAVPPVAT